MKKYEIMILTKGTAGEASAKATSDAVKALISEFSGELVSEDFWGKRKLAYKIGQETEGFYSVLDFKLTPQKVLDLKKRLNLLDNIVRYLVSGKTEKGE